MDINSLLDNPTDPRADVDEQSRSSNRHVKRAAVTTVTHDTEYGSQVPKQPNEHIGHIRTAWNHLLVASGIVAPFLPLLEVGRMRLSWRCGCGESFTGDFTETSPTSYPYLSYHRHLHIYGRKLYQSTGAKITTMNTHDSTGLRTTLTSYDSTGARFTTRTANNSNLSSQQNTIQSLEAIFRNVKIRVTRALKRLRDEEALPHHNSEPTTTGSSGSGPPLAQQVLHLLACMHSGRFRKSLYQERIENITTDHQLFRFMRRRYTRQRSLGKRLSLKTIIGVFFVKLRLPLGGSVEVRHHDPCCKAGSCECVPPPDLVEPAPRAEYRCIPGPPAVWPPIDPHYLAHLLNCPSYTNEHDTWILDQLPKRICGQIQGSAGRPAEAWGIYYQEGWDRDLIALIVFLVFLSGSLLFGVLWSKSKMDVQGAFGVSAYIMSACGIVISLIVLRADKN